MIHLGTPEDLNKPTLKRYCCIICYAPCGDDSPLVSFDHSFCRAVDCDAAYDSQEMYELEGKLLSKGHILKNNYVVEVSL